MRLAALSFWCNVRQAKIAVDGKVVAVTPFSGQVEVAPGRHQVSLSRDGYTTLEEIVEVPEAKQLHLRYRLEPLANASSWRSYLGWPVAVLGAGAVGGGIAAGLQAEQQYRGTPAFERWAGWQRAGYGGGGALLSLGVALLIWDAARESIPEADLVPGLQRRPGRELRPLRANEPLGGPR
jgi:hypothetical protein